MARFVVCYEECYECYARYERSSFDAPFCKTKRNAMMS